MTISTAHEICNALIDEREAATGMSYPVAYSSEMTGERIHTIMEYVGPTTCLTPTHVINRAAIWFALDVLDIQLM